MSRFLKLHTEDNVLVALSQAAKGTLIPSPNGEIPTLDEVSMAHKVADVAIPKGGVVIKYGMPIGEATTDIAAGAHVHVHNTVSRYTPTVYRAEEVRQDHD